MYGFQYIAGHEMIILRLRQAVDGVRAGHAYIFSGEKGMGKKMLANAFAKALQCETPLPGGDACGACLSCRVMESGNHPDVIYVKGTKTKSIGVDDVRDQIIRPMTSKPFRYRYKIFIIDEAETLTPAAQNALLKTIEEPAPYGIFIFLAAQTHTMLPTVLSRCATYRLHPIPDPLVLNALRDAGVPDEQSRFCASVARGNIGQALKLATSEDAEAMRMLALEVSREIRRMDIIEAFATYRRFEKWKESIQLLLDMLYLCYHDLIVREKKGETLKTLLEAADAITRTKKTLRQNGNFQLAVELLLLRLNGAA